MKIFVDPCLQLFGARLWNSKKARVFCDWNKIFGRLVLYFGCFILHKHRRVVFGRCFFLLAVLKNEIKFSLKPDDDEGFATLPSMHYTLSWSAPYFGWSKKRHLSDAAPHLCSLSLSARLLLLFPLFHSPCLYFRPPPNQPLHSIVVLNTQTSPAEQMFIMLCFSPTP